MAVFVKLSKEETQDSKCEALKGIVCLLKVISSVENSRAWREEKKKIIENAIIETARLGEKVSKIKNLLSLEEVEAKTKVKAKQEKEIFKPLKLLIIKEAKQKSVKQKLTKPIEKVKKNKYEAELLKIKKKLESLK